MRSESESDKWRDLECGDKELCTGVSIKTRNEEYFIMTSIATRRGASMPGFFNVSLNIKSPYKGFGTFDSLGRRDESELGIVTIRGFNLHKQLVQAVTREAGHLKLAGRNYFVSTSSRL